MSTEAVCSQTCGCGRLLDRDPRHNRRTLRGGGLNQQAPLFAPAAHLSVPLKLAYKQAFAVRRPLRNNVEIITAQYERGSPKYHLLHPVVQHLALPRLESTTTR